MTSRNDEFVLDEVALKAQTLVPGIDGAAVVHEWRKLFKATPWDPEKKASTQKRTRQRGAREEERRGEGVSYARGRGDLAFWGGATVRGRDGIKGAFGGHLGTCRSTFGQRWTTWLGTSGSADEVM